VAEDDPLELPEQGVHLVERERPRHIDRQADLSLVAREHELFLDAAEKEVGGDEDHNGQADDEELGLPRADGEPDDPLVERRQLDQPAGLFPCLSLEKMAAGKRDERQGDEKRSDEGQRDSQGKILHEPPEARLGHEPERDEDNQSRERGRGHGLGDLASPLERGLARGHPLFLPQAEDILQDDDAVVDKHPDGHHQPGERDDVDGDVGPEDGPVEVHEAESEDHGDGDGRGDDEGRPELAQEEHEDDDGEDAADDA
jgi:hypothetical protein